MIPRPFDPAPAASLALAGVTMLVALWHTTLIALGVSAWRTLRRRTPSDVEYRVTLSALVFAVALTAVTPVIVSSWPQPASGPVPHGTSTVGPGAAGLTADVAARLRIEALEIADASRIEAARRLFAWLGLAWLAGVTLGLARLTGGWLLARRIRRTATPIADPALVERAAAMCRAYGVAPALLASDRVETPVVIGHRRPAIVLPGGAERQLPSDAIGPLLAHEMMHIVRRDYAVNVVQSVADALLFFSPGARAISRWLRDAREFCCDDAVASQCGTTPYVRSLTTLAALKSAARPVLNVAGPRLIVRVKRLLEEDVMRAFPGLRLATLAGAAMAIAGTAPTVVATAASAMAPMQQASIPIAFVPRPDGAGLSVRSFTSNENGLCGTAVIRNDRNSPLTEVRFAAGVAAIAELLPRVLVISEPMSVIVAPGDVATVQVDLLQAEDARVSTIPGTLQGSCMLAEASFADGATWKLLPLAAQAIDVHLRRSQADIPRALIGTPATNLKYCFDDARREYSQGAIVAMRYEEGGFARCVGGAWVDYVLPREPPSGAK
jgi:beta-lactamase regulating signal transducer with metallopeptidase domain